MAMFVHLAPESRVATIRRNGIARLRAAAGQTPKGVFAVPVTRNFYVSHQWLRELKRRSQGTISAVYFRISDDQPVWVGHYGRAHRWLSAAAAVAEVSAAEDPLGWGVVIPRRIGAGEIHRTRNLSQVIGWRFHPKAKGKPPFCTCKFCTRGEYGAAKLRARLGTPDDD
ncbi:MAG TPA: hypothetical protein VHY37_07460 [Tepidisphaeraceae bacterium]|jgi:hypothetical protein|nr:hypothetical protein [Tepidisphaeraceae bacterium]